MTSVFTRISGLSLRAQLRLLAGVLIVAGLATTLAAELGARDSAESFETVAETTAPATTLLISTDRDAYQAQLAVTYFAMLKDSSLEAELAPQALADFEENAAQTLSRFEEYLHGGPAGLARRRTGRRGRPRRSQRRDRAAAGR